MRNICPDDPIFNDLRARAGRFGNSLASPAGTTLVSLGAETLDQALGGGLCRGSVHEIHSVTALDMAAAEGFALGLLKRCAELRPVVWVRQDFIDGEAGKINGSGLAELGLDWSRFILVRAKDVEGVLRAGREAQRCPELGGVLIEPWGSPKVLDLTASRRLTLEAAKSQVMTLLLRPGAVPSPSAAHTRWNVKAVPSRRLEANAPGFPAYEVSLLRHRAGVAGRSWVVEWDRDAACFQESNRGLARAPLPRAVVSVPLHRPVPPQLSEGTLRRAG